MKAALNMYLRPALRFVPVMALSLVIGCSPASTSTSTSTSTGSADKFIRPMSAPCIWKRDEPYRWEGYNDKPVDACLGPHHYRIPANYFADQMGPDFQANFRLFVKWPELQPFAPGKLDERGMEGFYKTISIYPGYVDRVPMTEYLENSIRSSPDKEGPPDPSENVALMDRQPQRFGLTPYYVNNEKFLAYKTERDRIQGWRSAVELKDKKDWYLARDAQGRLTTVIQCHSHLKPDGLLIQGDRLLDDPSTNAVCMHTFVIAEDKVVFHVDYGRVLLKDWQRFEDRARELLTTHRVR